MNEENPFESPKGMELPEPNRHLLFDRIGEFIQMLTISLGFIGVAGVFVWASWIYRSNEVVSMIALAPAGVLLGFLAEVWKIYLFPDLFGK